MLTISHLSWGAELSTSYDARSRLFGWREIYVIAGMTIVLAIPAFLELTGSSEQGIKVASMGWFCLIGFPILVLPLLYSVPDNKSSSEPSIEWRQALGVIFKNGSMLRLLIADFQGALECLCRGHYISL